LPYVSEAVRRTLMVRPDNLLRSLEKRSLWKPSLSKAEAAAPRS
jgi:hypothetical protein